jgi:hypothetical protein
MKGVREAVVLEAKKQKPNFKSNKMTIKTTPADIRRKAATTVGTPPATKVIVPKKNKKPKHKETIQDLIDGLKYTSWGGKSPSHQDFR